MLVNHPTKTVLLCLLLLLAGNSAFAATTAAKPNIVIILSDDYGYGSASCYGADPKLVRTPNIDRLAKEGRRFTDANTTSSVCSPTRYSVLTGRYCWRTSLKYEVLSTFAPLHIETTRLNMASMLKAQGYQTAAIGKWHLGYGTADGNPTWRTDYTAELSPGPLDIGFDYHFAVPSNHGDVTGVYVENRFVYGLRSGKIPPGMKVAGPVPDDDNFKPTYGPEDTENGKAKILDIDAPRRVNDRVMPELTDKAVHWLEEQKKDKPFFLYFTPVAVHSPVTPEKDLLGSSAAGKYGDWIHELDRTVGRILDTLDKQGLADNTLVIFSSDNGGVKEPAQKTTPQTLALNAGLATNGPLRGGKHHVWEGGFKVPFIVRWPGKTPPGTVCKDMISLADILATTAAIVDEKLPPASRAAEDSYNLLPAFLGDSEKPARDAMIVHSADGVFAIRQGPWKWIEGVPVDEINPGSRKAHHDEFHAQLYNLHDDPAETKDVSAEHPEVVKELTALLNRYRNGGYSREMPPIMDKPPHVVAKLPPLDGEKLINESFEKLPAKPWAVSHGAWTEKAGGVWGVQKPDDTQGACIHGPVGIVDGIIQYDIQFHGANRHSIRIETADKQSFRIVVSRGRVELTKNQSRGESPDKAENLGAKVLNLEADEWYPVRITFKGNDVTAQVNDVVVKGSHPIIGQEKTGMNLLVFGETAGFRNMVVAKQP